MCNKWGWHLWPRFSKPPQADTKCTDTRAQLFLFIKVYEITETAEPTSLKDMASVKLSKAI